jgi:hypothetical protein
VRHAVILVSLAACGRFDFGVHADGALDALPLAGVDTSIAQAYPTAVLEDHPLAYYRLDEASEMTAAVDVSGHANHGSFDLSAGGTATFATEGALVAGADLDPALRLTGDGNSGGGGVSNLRIPTTVFPWAADFTVEGWLKPRAPAPFGWNSEFFVAEHYGVSGFRTGWTIDLTPTLWTTEAGGSSTVLATMPLGLGVWNHLVITKAGSGVSIYVNGALAAQASIDYVAPSTMQTIETCFGACHGMPSDGVFDEVAIYDYALPVARIIAHRDVALGLGSQ